jgi:hypothetical protein
MASEIPTHMLNIYISINAYLFKDITPRALVICGFQKDIYIFTYKIGIIPKSHSLK